MFPETEQPAEDCSSDDTRIRHRENDGAKHLGEGRQQAKGALGPSEWLIAVDTHLRMRIIGRIGAARELPLLNVDG